MNLTRHLSIKATLVAVLAVTALASPALSVSFDVTTTLDGNDGACDAHCTLREAIIAANADRDRDVINLPPGTYRLSILGRGENHSASGDLDILERVDLRGSGRDTTIIDAGGIDRVLHVHRMDYRPGVESTKILDVTITGGEVRHHERGGGILVEGALAIEHSAVESNVAHGDHAAGGGIANCGSLSVTDVTIRYNATVGDSGGGGGIWNARGTLSLVDSTINENRTDGFAAHGAGLSSESGTVSILRATLSENDALGISSDGGGVWARSSTFSVIGCTVSANTAVGFLGGGGLWLGASTVVVINSTVSGNATTGVGATGGGIWTDLSTLTLSNTTFSGNSTNGEGAQGGAVWHGRGIVVVTNSLFNGECFLESSLLSGGGNIESPGNSCGFDWPGDQSGVSASALALGPLADNGGPTLTHALLAGSTAIDSGRSIACPGMDQRGEQRPRDGDGDGHAMCDVGAFEADTVQPGGAAYSHVIPEAARLAGSAGTTRQIYQPGP
jgi:CSLREA domain-containing protein